MTGLTLVAIALEQSEPMKIEYELRIDAVRHSTLDEGMFDCITWGIYERA